MEVTTSAASEDPEATQQDTEHVDACLEQHVDRPVTQDAVTVEVKVTNITRRDLDVLEQTLSEWVLWHRRTYQQGYPPDVQLMSGSIGLNDEQFKEDGPVSWVDKLRVVSRTGSAVGHGAAQYEQIEAPPLYDRAVSELLAPARAAAGGGGISMLPGGSEATKRRARAEACYMFDSKDSSVPAQIAVKRKKLSDNRCFNCGSYAHGLADCTKPMDQERISAARAEQAANRGRPTGFMSNFLRNRYFDAKLDDKASGADSLRPGCISCELAEALGMASDTAPPPWLSRMAALGLPPRYLVTNHADIDGRMEFFMGSEEEQDDDNTAQGTESAAISSKSDASTEACEQLDETDADFVPIGVDAVHAQQHQTGGSPQETQYQQPAKQFDAERQQQLVNQPEMVSDLQVVNQCEAAKEQQPPGVIGVMTEPPQSVQSQHRYTHLFPGINAALPEGADVAAWRAELDKAAHLSRLMGWELPVVDSWV